MSSPLTWMPGRCVAFRVQRTLANEPQRTTSVINTRRPHAWSVGGTSAKMRLPQIADSDGPASPPPVLAAAARRRRQWRRRQRRRSILLDSTEPLKTQEEMEAEPAPPPAAGPSTDGVLQRHRRKQDTLASEDRLKARLGQTQTNTHQAVESSDAALREGLGEVQAKYRVAVADFVETYVPHRRGGAFPANLLKTKLQLGRVQTVQLRVSGPHLCNC